MQETLLSAPTTPALNSSASSLVEVDLAAALRPDPGTEADFQVDNNPFAFSPGQLNKLLNPKSLQAFVALGGLPGIERGIRTDIDAGLSLDEASLSGQVSFEDATEYSKKVADLDENGLPRPILTRAISTSTANPNDGAFRDRVRVYNRNVLPTKKATPLWKLMWNAYNDKVLLLLTGAAVISLALGLYETLGV